jgi:hypothetical protein
MSNIDFKQHLLHAVSGLRSQGLSTAEVIALVIGDSTKKPAPAAAPETERMVSIELENGATKLVPASSVPAKVNTHAVTNGPCLVEWVRPEGFVPDVIPEPAPKPKYVAPHEIMQPKRGATSYDISVVGRYSEEWVPPADYGTPTPEEKAEIDETIGDAEREIAEMEAALATRRAEHATFKAAIAGPDGS